MKNVNEIKDKAYETLGNIIEKSGDCGYCMAYNVGKPWFAEAARNGGRIHRPPFFIMRGEGEATRAAG